MSDQTVTVRKVLPASREEVFDAWLDAEGMRKWMCPGPVTSCEAVMEPRLGGRFRIVMKAPNAEIVNAGEIRVLERPSKLAFSWVSSRWGNEETLVTIELHERPSGCELILTHERVPAGHPVDQLRQGWSQILEKLGNYL